MVRCHPRKPFSSPPSPSKVHSSSAAAAATMTFSDLRALHTIIGVAIDDIERIYRPMSSLRRPSQSSMSTSSTRNHGRSSSKPPSSASTDSDADADESDVPLTPLTASNLRIQQSASPNSVRFASSRKRRERSYTMSAVPHSSPVMPPPILKQPPLDFPPLDIPILTTDSSSATSNPAISSKMPRSVPSSPLKVQNIPLDSEASTTPPVDPSQRHREWRKKCEDMTAHPEVIKAVNKIVAACGQLSAAVQKPFLTVCDAAMGYHLPACLRFLEETHLPEMLREAGSRGLSSAEIAQKISQDMHLAGDTKILDSNKLSHILRLLATHHITREVRPDVFANNRVSSVMDTGKPWAELAAMKDAPECKYEGTDGIAAFVGLCTDELFKASAYLTDCYLVPPRSASPPPPVPPKSPTRITRSGTPQSPLVPPSPASSTFPPCSRPSVSAPVGRLAMATPNDSTSSLGSLIQSSPGRDSAKERELGDSPMTFAHNPHPTPKSRTRTKSSGWNFSSLQTIPASPPTPQSASRPSILKRLSSRTFTRPSTAHAREPSPTPPLPLTPGTPRSNTFDTPETPRSRCSSSDPLMKEREDPTTPRSPRSHSQNQPSFSSMLNTPKGTPAQDMLRTPRSTPSRESFASDSRAMHPRGQRWTPSRESLRGLGKKGSFASLKVSTGRHGAEDGGLLGPAFDLVPVRGQGREGEVPPVPRIYVVENRLSAAPSVVLPPVPLPQVVLNDKGHAQEKKRPRKGLQPGDEMYAPFNVAFGTGMRYFEWLEKRENAFRLRRFGKAMTGTEKWEVPGSIIGGFPWHELVPGSVVVDVGGGIGSTSMLLANAFPHLKFVIQDRPPVVEMGTAAWRSRYPDLLDTGRAFFMAHDFFKPQPPLPADMIVRLRELESESEVEELGRKVMGGDEEGPVREVKPAVFLMRVITHDWPDSYVTRILLRLRQAAGPKTRLLLADYVLPLACVDEDEDVEIDVGGENSECDKKITRDSLPGTLRTLAPEGSPLLSNLGKASANAYWLDLTMRAMFNAQERTLRELSALARSAGWKIVQVTRTEGALFGHLIAVPVEIPAETPALPVFEETAEGESSSDAHDDTVTDMHSLPIGDTFLSSVDLPSEATIREGVASGTSKLNAARQGSADERRRRRARAYTFTGKDGKDGKGGEVRKGFKTILRMLSKPQVKPVEGAGV